jgi:hypothetical protein
MSNRRKPKGMLCGYCRERPAEHQVNAPGGFWYACPECWPLLEEIVKSMSGVLLPCSCGGECESGTQGPE